jgi:FKBP-type peptidyl-prolyl cis-trans isomerase FkpA/FKBP-type peptidyl-prolyl cis-trans isomerase FklB
MNYVLKRGIVAALSCVALSCALTDMASAQAPPKAAPDAAAKAPGAMSEDQQTLYALGAILSRNLDGFTLSEAEFNTVRQGFVNGYHKKADTKDVENPETMTKISALLKDRTTRASDAFLAKAAAAPGATKTATGLIFVSVKAGTGATPTRTDRVKVTYEGRLIDGTVFDASAQHGGSATFPVTGVIACWTEALQLMKVGGKSRIVCPAAIAYGQRGAPPKIRPGSTLEFDIELLEIEPPAPAASSSSGGAAPAPAERPAHPDP